MKQRKIQKVNVTILVTDLECFNYGDVFIPPNSIYKLLINYPCKDTYFPIRTHKKRMSLAGILKKVGQAYETIYSDSDKYGVWGHVIDDLVIEEVRVDHEKKLVTLLVGS